MGKINLLTKSNLKTSKGASICVFVLLFVASLLLNLSLILFMDYKNNFYVSHDNCYAEHICINTCTTDSDFYDFVSDSLKNDSSVSDYEIIESFSIPFHIPFNGGNYSTSGVFFKYDDAINKRIGKNEFIGDVLDGEGIYLPYLFKVNGSKLGEVVSVSFGDNVEHQYKILGFFNSVMAGSNNCAMTSFLLTNNIYNDIKNEVGSSFCGYFTSIRLYDSSKAEVYEGYFSEVIKSNIEINSICSNNYLLISTSRYITQMITSAIILVVSAIITVIAIIISSANLKEYIKDNMKKIGALKALGYTSFDIITSFILQFGIISLLASILGVILSYAFLPFLNSMLIAQTGIPYNIHFVISAALITIVLFVICILLTIFLSCLKIRRIEAIDALREGITTHSFKKNIFNLDKKGLGLNLGLGLKTMFNNIRGNITILITAFVLTFVLIFDLVLLFNSVITFDPMVKLICAITPDGMVYVSEDDENDLIMDLKSNEDIINYYFCSSTDVSINDTSIWTQIAEAKDVEKDLIAVGKAPIYKNEIAIGGKFAKDSNIEIGDTISVTLNGITKNLIVTGYTQNSNYLGKDALLSREGFNQFEYECPICYNIYVNDLSKLDDILNEFKTIYGSEVINYAKETESFTGVYKNLLTIVFYAILVITLLVVAFVLFLLVRNLLDKKKKEYGILKSIGFETKDLIKQTMISFLPMLLIGAILGGIMGYLFMNNIMSLALGGIGLFKCNLEIPLYSIFVTAALIVLFSMGIVYLQSLRIKKIDTYKLLIAE
ncbi:MAG: ABC transporter permease [Anaeroplasmataceae bacterium]